MEQIELDLSKLISELTILVEKITASMDLASSKSMSDMISSIANLLSSILWPTIAFIAIFMFKTEIRRLIRRIKKGKVFGHEFELKDDIDKLENTTEEAQKNMYLPSEDIIAANDFEHTDRKLFTEEEEIIKRATENPELGLILLGRKIEDKLRKLMARTGNLKGGRPVSFLAMIDYLQRNKAIPENLIESIKMFWKVRNKVVHGYNLESQDNIIRIIDIGLTVLNAIKAIPYEINIVYHPGVSIFSDEACCNQIPNVLGVILETTSPGRAEKSHRIFPTTREHFRKGMVVSWDWNMENRWGKAYYRDPETNEIKEAWGGAGEFVGQDLEKI